MTERPRRASWPWTPADDAALRALVLKGANTREIAYEVNRTIESIRTRAKRLNITLKRLRRRLGSQ
jgi:transposase